VKIKVANLADDLSKFQSLIDKNMSCDVEIKFYPYSDETDSLELLHLDMISGEEFDVVYAQTEDIYKLIKRGYMTDLSPLMEQSETLKKEDFLPNVLAGLEVDGKIPAICNNWQLFTAAAKTSNVGENMESWTPAQAFEAYNNMPEDMNFLYIDFKEYDTLNYFMSRVIVDSVDYKNNTCNFSGAFMETLERINNLPEVPKYEPDESSLVNNHALVKDVWLFGINSTLTQQIYVPFGGEDITFVGYPSESGKGYTTNCFSMFAIPETSKHKTQAYEFISFMINDYLTNGNGVFYTMPITERHLQIQLNESKYSGSSVNCPQYLPNSTEQVQISEEILNKAVDYIRRVELEPYKSSKVDNIIFTEYHKCFAGETTPQKCADTLNDRISLYLSENE
ncbi:MAG: extracellular solute-binding protein, partial [Ruminococcus sp.]|nr:extracellular solute-binding protein [Ruminococcus sp.]